MKQGKSNPTKLPMTENGLQDELEFLFAEVGVLANRLKISTRTVHARDKLPVGGKSILQTLAQAGSQTVPQIARRRSSSRQNIQVLINRLESDGWVEFVENPAHKRSDLVRLTERGRALLTAANEREATFLAGLLKHTSEAEVLSAGELLMRLRQLLEGRTPAPVARSPKQKIIRAQQRDQDAVAKQPKPESEPEQIEDGLPLNLL